MTAAAFVRRMPFISSSMPKVWFFMGCFSFSFLSWGCAPRRDTYITLKAEKSNPMKSTRFSRQFCPNCFVCSSYLYRREGDRVRGAGLEKRVNPSYAVRSMPCHAPLPARTPPSGGFFRPFLPPTAPKPAVFAPLPCCFPGKTQPEAAVSAPQPPGFPGFRPALRPGCRPKRARCAPFPGKPARFCPGSPAFSRCAPAPCPRSRPFCARRHPAHHRSLP